MTAMAEKPAVLRRPVSYLDLPDGLGSLSGKPCIVLLHIHVLKTVLLAYLLLVDHGVIA